MQFRAENPEDLDSIALKTLMATAPMRIFAISGAMGAGKTTLIRSFCKALECSDLVSSPTFSIVNEYITGLGETIYHFDLYRIEKESEVFDLGYEHYLYSGNYCFIEWPEKFGQLLDLPHCRIHLDESEGTRLISVSV